MQEKYKRITITISGITGSGALCRRNVLYGEALSHEIDEAVLQDVLNKFGLSPGNVTRAKGLRLALNYIH